MDVAATIALRTDELSEREWRRLFGRLRFIDDEQEVHEPWRVLPHKKTVEIPRGAWALLPSHVRYRDYRIKPRGSEFNFKAELDAEGFDGQKKALRAMLEQEQGLVIGQPGFGKTNVALAFASCCETPTLILVHTEDILQQWVDRIHAIVPDAKVGVIRGTDLEIGDITIATVQTLHRRLQLKGSQELKNAFGCVILDEAHHAPASTFDEILNQMPAHYRFGFTATDKRADGKHPYMATIIGPVIYRKKFKSKVPVEVIPIKTQFNYRYRGSWDWRNLLNKLVEDEDRASLIAKAVVAEIKDGNSCLVLSREISHLNRVYDHIELEFDFDEGWTQQVETLTGKRTKQDRLRILDEFRAGKVKCLLATQLADEALDVPILSRVFLTFPGKHAGRIIQQVGRALREHPTKTEARIYDVVDDKIGLLRRQWMERKQAYKMMDIPIRKKKGKLK